LETVAGETPASRATSLIVARREYWLFIFALRAPVAVQGRSSRPFLCNDLLKRYRQPSGMLTYLSLAVNKFSTGGAASGGPRGKKVTSRLAAE
jgi:hypothetical protein